jgi:hypothetical protein
MVNFFIGLVIGGLLSFGWFALVFGWTLQEHDKKVKALEAARDYWKNLRIGNW